MKFSIARGDLLESLAVVTKALSSRTTLPILSGILLTADKDTVVLQATDLEISIRDRVVAGVEDSGSVVVPGRLLADVVRSLPEAAVRLETSSYDQLKVTCGTSSFTLKTLPPDDFPKFPEVAPSQKATLSKDTLSSLVRQVSKAVSRDESRPILTGVLFVLADQTVRMVATDSYRLAIAETQSEQAPDERIEVVVPGKALEDVPKLAGSADAIEMGVADNQVVFGFGETTYVTRRIEGNFPNYRQLVPADGDTKVKVKREEVLEAAKRVSLMAQHNAPLRLTIEESTLSLSARTQDVGEATEALMVETQGGPLEIAFNHAFLLDGLASSEEEELEFVATSPLKPGVFRTVGGAGYVCLIMPVRP